uniref:dUTP diphosphatase n=1 Tax=Spodoptera litura multicapsid nucleopolyhedrovirus TaxID=46242 RepID=A0A6B9UYQ9_NPVST|nr:dUTPase [Spodoptera litura nucleopolyhedrovirus]UQV25542.1 dUTP pyrophosphatase [Spodoptera litura nucleopolyhedrovirus]WML75080.1 deoxyuridine 5'-triphosphate nucleotidohydrolase [Spodoptera littoralis nucleopolyhedrovirus]WOC30875.1 Deoxyuridine 5'-triphosphate nucleotidohydrolase [Spodoptera litura nucleopolyhedrovirus]
MDNNFVVETSVEQQFVINMKQIESRPQLKYLKLSEHAYEPTYGSDGAAGLDLKSAHDYIIKSNSRAVIKTDLAICIPKDCYARIAPRSGLSVKHSIDVGAGVIDHDYRGNVGIVLINNGEFNFVINRGDRVAQLICERIYRCVPVAVESLDGTIRGDGGFGSTGI